MGITNFCKLLDVILMPATSPDPFDSILIDIQSFLYVAIDLSLHNDEGMFMREVCAITWSKLSGTLDALLSRATEETITLVVSFDGNGVPMKWPTQRKRRAKDRAIDGKNVYRHALFGANTISLRVQRHIVHKLKSYKFPNVRKLCVVVCGCTVPGEGEHKMFHVAESDVLAAAACRKPVVVSVDQDVFVLAFMRVDRYEAIQVYRYGRYYNVTRLLRDSLSYPIGRLVTATFLFGNDFIPPLVAITPFNAPFIHECLDFGEPSSSSSAAAEEEEEKKKGFSPSFSLSESPDSAPSDDFFSERTSPSDESNPAAILARCIRKLKSKIRYKRAAYVDPQMIVDFWNTTLWCRDYYTKCEFRQKYLENPIYDSFDRDQLLTGLSDARFSTRLWLQAKTDYEATETTRRPDTAESLKVFANDEVREKIRPYLIATENSNCTKLNLTKRSQTRPKSPVVL